MKNLKLKAARAAKDLSQEHLALLCNVSLIETYLSAIHTTHASRLLGILVRLSGHI